MKFSEKHFETALSYPVYSEYAEALLTGISNDSTNPMRGYAAANLHIIQRLKKSVKITDELTRAISSMAPVMLVILTEGYCGDSAQTFPVFGKMQELFPDKIEIKVVLRDENLDTADKYFRTRAIPRLICLDRLTLTEKFNWGNRPMPAKKLMDDLKEKGRTMKEKSVQLHHWYAKDKTMTLQNELTQLFGFECKKKEMKAHE
ncbi:MAG: thioredoxin family protein [Bacteroidota bacterium]|nr:thioredoxin family protein [Bacteroidota bacterium]